MQTTMQLNDWVGLAKDIITALGIIIAGIWTWMLFIRQRTGETKARLKHIVETFPTDVNQIYVRAILEVENKGTVKVAPPRFNTTVQYVLPVPPEIREKIQSGDLVSKNEYEFPWPSKHEYNINLKKDDWEVEPGETERLYLDFFVPAHVKLIQIHSRLFESDDKESQWWDDAVLVKLR